MKNKLFKTSLIFFLNQAFAASLISRGVAVGIPLGAILEPQFVFDNISLYFSEPKISKASTNVMADSPTIGYSTKTRFIDNQFKFILAPAVVWEKSAVTGKSWHYGTTSPLFLGGLAHPIAPGIGIAGYIGGMAPLRSGVSEHNEWVFVNLNSISYTRDDYNITLTMIYGNPGKNLTTNIKDRPNFLNLDFTATGKFSGIEFGPIWYYSQDLNTKVIEQQFAIGGLIGLDICGWTTQFWFGHDLYANNYERQTMNGYFRLTKVL